jgi:DNA-binding GntR family transcriptional regulator
MRTSQSSSTSLLKDHLASSLKQAIMDGRLSPGQRVVEGRWADEFGAAQASVREAINLLIAEGFLMKDSGRSARVVNYREQDVAQIYDVRAALEGMAAELACAKSSDLSVMEVACQRMAASTSKRRMKELIQSDLDFHIGLIQSSGNPVLAALGSKLLFPLFAFIQIRVLKSGQGPEAWERDIHYHKQILQVIRDGDPNLAGQYVRYCVRRFAISAYQVWENVGGSVEAHGKGQRSRGRKARS